MGSCRADEPGAADGLGNGWRERPLVVLKRSAGRCRRLVDVAGAGIALVAADGAAIRDDEGDDMLDLGNFELGETSPRGTARGAGEPSSTGIGSRDSGEAAGDAAGRGCRPGVPLVVPMTRAMTGAGAGALTLPLAVTMVARLLLNMSFEEFGIDSTTACKLDELPWS